MRECISKCDLCGTSLYNKDRWQMKLYTVTPLGPIELKTLHLCANCLKTIIADIKQRKNLKIKRKQMRVLRSAAGAPKSFSQASQSH